MTEKYYTVEQISEMLSIHPKTVQRYIREGKLRAGKIGKSWRVSGHDLSAFTESEKDGGRPHGQNGKMPAEARASSVVDIALINKEEAIRIADTLTAVLNSKPPEYGSSSMHTQYIEEESKLRVTLWGGLRFMEVMMSTISALTEQIDE